MLEDVKVPVRLKLSALWAALMFCYVYGDYFGLYRPGQLQDMLQGGGPIGPTSQGTLVGVSMLMAIPSLMVFLPIVLPPTFNRWTNIALALVYVVIVGARRRFPTASSPARRASKRSCGAGRGSESP
jgi:Family of unknown function (DUF6326)